MLIDKGYDTDWQRAIQQTAFLQDHHIAFMGGGERSGYRVSLGYMDHQGVILHDKLRNLTSNMNMHQRMFSDLLTIEVGMFGNVQKKQTAVYDEQKTFYSAQAWNPTFGTKRNSGGGWDGFTLSNQINHPLALRDSRTQDKTIHLSTHAKLTFNLTQNWTLSLFGAYSHNEVEIAQFLPTSIWSGGKGYRSSAKTESWLGNATITWDKTVGAAPPQRDGTCRGGTGRAHRLLHNHNGFLDRCHRSRCHPVRVCDLVGRHRQLPQRAIAGIVHGTLCL